MGTKKISTTKNLFFNKYMVGKEALKEANSRITKLSDTIRHQDSKIFYLEKNKRKNKREIKNLTKELESCRRDLKEIGKLTKKYLK